MILLLLKALTKSAQGSFSPYESRRLMRADDDRVVL